MKKLAGVILSLTCAAGVAQAENELLDADGVLEVNVASGEQLGLTDDQKTALADPLCVELKKTGDGDLKFSSAPTALKNFKGKITIAAGSFTVNTSEAVFGTGDGVTEVLDGATLRFLGYAMASYWSNEEVIVGGQGLNNGGALRRENPTNTGTCTLGFKKLTLRSDTLAITTDSDRGIEIMPKVLDMGGHLLRYEGMNGGFVCIDPTEIANDGDIYIKCSKCNFRMPNTASMTGGASHTLTLDIQGVPSYSQHRNFCNWTLKLVNNNSGIRAYNPPFLWDGPVQLPASGTIEFQPNYAPSRSGDDYRQYMRFNGPITGGATIKNTGDEKAYLILAGTNSIPSVTWGSGNTKGVTVFMVPEAAPADIFGAGVTYVGYQNGIALGAKTAKNPGGWDFTSITNAWEQQFQKKMGHIQVYVDKDDVFEPEADLDSTFNYYWRQKKSGVNDSLRAGACGYGEMILKGSFANPSWWKNYWGENFVITAKNPGENDRDFGSFYTDGGMITFRDMGYFTINGLGCGMLGTSQRGEVVIEGNSVLKGSGISIGARDQGSSGRLTLKSGVIVSNYVSIAHLESAKTCNGALMLRGATFCATGETKIGGALNSTAAVEVEGGLFLQRSGSLFLARYKSSSCGLLNQTGGLVEVGLTNNTRYVCFGAGTSTVHVAGGEFRVHGAAYLPMSLEKGADCEGGRGDLTVSGGTATFDADICLNDRCHSEGYINLNGGVLKARQILRQTACWSGGVVITGGYSAVSFNGGTLKAARTGDLFGTGAKAPDDLIVRAGGAVIDTDGYDVTIGSPLKKVPTAGGITALTLGSALTYYSRPTVLIQGDGFGATAIADYDYDTFQVSGVTITNPGWGYTAAKTKAWVYLNGDKQYKALTVTIGENAVSGGLVKTGAGVLTLAATNTYEGATVIAGGTLKVAATSAVPADLTLAGGALEVENVADFPETLNVDLGTLDKNVRRYVLAHFPNGRPATIPEVTGYTVPEGEEWVVRYSGNDLVLAYKGGMTLIVK